MPDYFEIDFLDVESDKSGDAIAIRYSVNGVTQIHVVDGGFLATGQSIVNHIRKFYGNPEAIDRVVLTHSDGDHAAGLRTVLEEFSVRELWMLRPWNYAIELLPRFPTYYSAQRLAARLRSIYPQIAALEEIALRKRIAIHEPFQGARLGAFTVLAPSRSRYLELIVASEKTPETLDESLSLGDIFTRALTEVRKAVSLVAAEWGFETFSPEETSAENEMSVVQHARICNESIVLTGDAGRGALTEAADYAPLAGLALPGVNRIQVPHHGSRRNVSSELLDRWLGPKLATMPGSGKGHFSAICSSAKADTHHPRKVVERAFIHRGANFFKTEGKSHSTNSGAPSRAGWSLATAAPYPTEIEK